MRGQRMVKEQSEYSLTVLSNGSARVIQVNFIANRSDDNSLLIF